MPSNCQQFEDYLLEDEESLSKSQLKALQAHLDDCPTCLEEREIFLDSWNGLDEMESELTPSPMLRARVWEEIRREESQPTPLVSKDSLTHWKSICLRISAAAAALFLGFTLGQGIKKQAAPSNLAVASENTETTQNLDPALIELASQEGFSVEIFPETTEFSPLDEEMISALAPSQEAEEWLNKDQQVAVPVRFISQDGKLGRLR